MKPAASSLLAPPSGLVAPSLYSIGATALRRVDGGRGGDWRPPLHHQPRSNDEGEDEHEDENEEALHRTGFEDLAHELAEGVEGCGLGVDGGHCCWWLEVDPGEM